MSVLENYQQSALITTEEEIEIAKIIEKKAERFPVEVASLYRGVCLGEKYKIGDKIKVSKKFFASWTEELSIAEEFSKERGPDISAVFEIEEGEIFGLPLKNTVDREMEWLILSKEYYIIEIEENQNYTLYVIK